ncbi:hypothetical protein BR93DRAFT_887960 [Coniochaeta sp. PMI_546]|nr:hypothetical protein BR93DRAFT_887960 [Coniochaeta sp. PMI_546]
MSNFREAILMATQAASLPETVLQRALVDSFIEHMSHLYPVVDPSDLENPGSCVLLDQALCLAGSLTRHSSASMKLSRLLYEKVKTLISVNYEEDHVQTLKALCILSCWSLKPPDQISVDGPWHWTGVATRLAIQMGLHEESTYAKRPNARCLRRIFWHLVNSDKLQVCCWGRPPLLRLKDLDVRMLAIEDFEKDTLEARSFIQTTKLSIIIGVISELNLEKRPIQPEEVTSITARLCDWIYELPEELRLHETAGDRRRYHRPTSEMFIEYFVAVIVSQNLMHERDKRWRTSVLSIIASSCIVTLYEEIYYREHAVCLLPIHGFFCMAAALPLIHYRPTSTRRESLRIKQIDMLRSIMMAMRTRYGGSSMVLRKIDRLQRHVTASVRNDEGQTAFYTNTQEPPERAHELFPFPPTICEDMDLLELTATSHGQFVADNLVPLENELDTVFRFDEPYPLIDVLDMDFGAFNESNLTQQLVTPACI